MSNSLSFCVAAATDKTRSAFHDRDWSKAYELDSELIFDAVLHKNRRYVIDGTDDTGNPRHITVDICFNDDSDFQYFTSATCIHDGTLLFTMNLLEECVRKVCGLQTYYRPLGEPQNNTVVKINVGNFIVLNEYDEEGVRFAPKEKRWMCECTTVFLPLKMEYKK